MRFSEKPWKKLLRYLRVYPELLQERRSPVKKRTKIVGGKLVEVTEDDTSPNYNPYRERRGGGTTDYDRRNHERGVEGDNWFARHGGAANLSGIGAGGWENRGKFSGGSPRRARSMDPRGREDLARAAATFLNNYPHDPPGAGFMGMGGTVGAPFQTAPGMQPGPGQVPFGAGAPMGMLAPGWGQTHQQTSLYEQQIQLAQERRELAWEREKLSLTERIAALEREKVANFGKDAKLEEAKTESEAHKRRLDATQKELSDTQTSFDKKMAAYEERLKQQHADADHSFEENLKLLEELRKSEEEGRQERRDRQLMEEDLAEMERERAGRSLSDSTVVESVKRLADSLAMVFRTLAVHRGHNVHSTALDYAAPSSRASTNM